MWVSRTHFEHMQTTLGDLRDALGLEKTLRQQMSTIVVELRTQKAKDDITIDWMRHRVNALEKQNALLLGKAAGIHVPVPEIVPTRPGTMTEIPDFPVMPTFEDCGDGEAARLGITHNEDGSLTYTK